PTMEDAQLNQNAITGATYCSINPNTQTLYVRVSSLDGLQCADFTTLSLTVEPRPEPLQQIADYVICDQQNPGDGIEVFDLTLWQDQISDQAGIAFSFFSSMQD